MFPRSTDKPLSLKCEDGKQIIDENDCRNAVQNLFDSSSTFDGVFDETNIDVPHLPKCSYNIIDKKVTYNRTSTVNKNSDNHVSAICHIDYHVPAQHCQGEWYAPSCDTARCEQTLTSTYDITQPAAYGGADCPYSDGDQRTSDCPITACVPAEYRQTAVLEVCPDGKEVIDENDCRNAVQNLWDSDPTFIGRFIPVSVSHINKVDAPKCSRNIYSNEVKYNIHPNAGQVNYASDTSAICRIVPIDCEYTPWNDSPCTETPVTCQTSSQIVSNLCNGDPLSTCTQLNSDEWCKEYCYDFDRFTPCTGSVYDTVQACKTSEGSTQCYNSPSPICKGIQKTYKTVSPGVMSGTRTTVPGTGIDGGVLCTEPLTRQMSCDYTDCSPVDCVGNWAPFTPSCDSMPCERTDNVQTRTFVVDTPAMHGGSCPTTESQTCPFTQCGYHLLKNCAWNSGGAGVTLTGSNLKEIAVDTELTSSQEQSTNEAFWKKTTDPDDSVVGSVVRCYSDSLGKGASNRDNVNGCYATEVSYNQAKTFCENLVTTDDEWVASDWRFAQNLR